MLKNADFEILGDFSVSLDSWVAMEVKQADKQIEFGFGTLFWLQGAVIHACFYAKLNLTSYLRRMKPLPTRQEYVITCYYPV